MERVATTIRNLRERHCVEAWDARYHRSVFLWAGHLARMSKYDSNRGSYQAFIFKNWAWIRGQSSEHGNQQHHRRLKTWRWERPLCKYFDPDPWEPAALDEERWNQLVPAMVAWRLQTR
eukprot:7988178-Karenia_brevis.AAC.1